MKNLVADSSFYLCFLDDIKLPGELKKILSGFKAQISPRIHAEISKSENFHHLKGSSSINIFSDSILELGSIVKPFFSKDETAKGEHEVVVVAYVVYNLDKDIVIVIDEAGPREFLTSNFDYLTPFLKGTVGLVGECCYYYKIFNKEESLHILKCIDNSKFRCTNKIINSVKEKIENS